MKMLLLHNQRRCSLVIYLSLPLRHIMKKQNSSYIGLIVGAELRKNNKTKKN